MIVTPLFGERGFSKRVADAWGAMMAYTNAVVMTDEGGVLGNGFQVVAGSGLNIIVKSGEAIVRGVHVVSDVDQQISLPASSTKFVLLRVIRDANDRPIDAEIVISDTNLHDRTTKSDYLALAQVTTTSTITNIVDLRGFWHYPVAYYIDTATSGGKNFPGARGIFARVTAWGGGGGGGRLVLQAPYVALGGQGGSCARETIMLLQNGGVGVQISWVVGAGGSGGTAGSGGAGGDTTVQISVGTASKTITAKGGSGGTSTSGGTAVHVGQTDVYFDGFGSNGYDEYIENISAGSNTNVFFGRRARTGIYQTVYAGATYYPGYIINSINTSAYGLHNLNSSYGRVLRSDAVWSGGCGGALYYDGSTHPYSPSTSIFAGSGGTASSTGYGAGGGFPAGGGGAGKDGGGPGASGRVIIEAIIFY